MMQTILLDGLEIRVGDGGDLTEDDLAALQLQHAGRELPLPSELVTTIVRVMRVLPGARVVGPE